jgi:hypothetical protein
MVPDSGSVVAHFPALRTRSIGVSGGRAVSSGWVSGGDAWPLAGALCALPAAIAKRVRGDAVTHPIADDGRFPAVADGVTIALAGREAGDGMRPAIAGAEPIGLSTVIALARPGHQGPVIDSDGGWAYRRLRRDPARKERRT